MAKPKPAAVDFAPLIDELGNLGPSLTKLKPLAKRAEAIRAALKAAFTNPAKGGVLRGACFLVEISPQEERREVVSMAAVQKALGPKRFLETVTVSIGELEKLLPIQELDKLIAVKRTGPRQVEVRPLEA